MMTDILFYVGQMVATEVAFSMLSSAFEISKSRFWTQKPAKFGRWSLRAFLSAFSLKNLKFRTDTWAILVFVFFLVLLIAIVYKLKTSKTSKK